MVASLAAVHGKWKGEMLFLLTVGLTRKGLVWFSYVRKICPWLVFLVDC